MTEQQEKARFRQAIDHTLLDIQGDAFLAQRVLARAEKGAKPMKYHIPKTIVIALIALLCMGTVALAAGLYGGTVNWLGEVVPDEQYVVEGERSELAVQIDAWAEQLSREGELLQITAREDGRIVGQLTTDIMFSVQDMDSFMALMDGEAYIPVPRFLPDGYEFVTGSVRFTCRGGGRWQMTERTTLADGVVAERYQVEETERLVCGYSLYFLNEADDTHLAVIVKLTTKQDDTTPVIGFDESPGRVKALEVPGMQNAILQEAEGYRLLAMKKEMAEAVLIRDFQQQESSLEEITIIVDAPLLDVDTLVRMFAE